jgi:tetratricopeptide (TPR) repeat protein
MTLSRNAKIALGIAALILIALAAYLIFNHKGGTMIPVDTGAATTTKGGAYTLEPLPAGQSLSEIMPDPSQPIAFDASVPADIRAQVTTKANGLAASLKADPTNTGDWLELALTYDTGGDYDKAEAIWKALIKVLPNDATAYGNLGRLEYLNRHNNAAAEAYFKEEIAKAPQLKAGYLDLYGVYLQGEHNGTSAAGVAREALAVFPNDTDFLVLAAEAYVNIGDKKTASDYYTKAVDAARASGDLSKMKAIQDEYARVSAE